MGVTSHIQLTRVVIFRSSNKAICQERKKHKIVSWCYLQTWKVDGSPEVNLEYAASGMWKRFATAVVQDLTQGVSTIQ